MTGKKIRDYKNKCGSCMYFSFICRYGDTRSDGRCEKKDRVNYHQACQKACKLYKAESEDEEC